MFRNVISIFEGISVIGSKTISCQLFKKLDFYVSLAVHPCIMLQMRQNWCTIFLSVFISFLCMFRETMCPSSGETTVFMWHLVLVILYGWLSGMQGGIPNTRQSSLQNNKYQVSHKYSFFSWWWAHSRPKHVEKRNKHTKKIVHQVGFIYKVKNLEFDLGWMEMMRIQEPRWFKEKNLKTPKVFSLNTKHIWNLLEGFNFDMSGETYTPPFLDCVLFWYTCTSLSS